MSTITQETPKIDSQGIDGPKLPDYPALPSDEVMTKELTDARAKNFKDAVVADQSANPSDVSPFNIDVKQEEKMLPSAKDTAGGLVVSGLDKYSKSK